MTSIKTGVTLLGLTPEILIGHMVVEGAFLSMDKDCVITSVTDSKHGRASLHYSGQAIDYRTRHLSEAEKTRLLNKVSGALHEEFDVILESDHLHVEFQPKR